MRPPPHVRVAILIVAIAVAAAACTGGTTSTATGVGGTAPPGADKLEHLIFIVQENRSFDHYFGTYPGADGIPTNPDGSFAVCIPDTVPGRQVRQALRRRGRSCSTAGRTITRRR